MQTADSDDVPSLPPAARQADSPRGIAMAVGTYVIWGLMPLYMHMMSAIPAAEIIAHRVLWSLPIAGAVLAASGEAHLVRAALRQRRTVALAALTATLISVNWLIYVWAVNHGRAIEAALGYYINPLFTVALGAAFLGERLSRLQIVAVAIAAAAVAVLSLSAGGLPLVAVGLTTTWGIYAFCKRRLPVPPNAGFTIEVLMLSLPALVYLVHLAAAGRGHFGVTAHDTLLLIGSGVVTAVPLILYANAARLVRLSTIGVLQYISPTMVFLCALLIFGEPYAGAQQIAFPMIWTALALYVATLVRPARGR